MLDDMHRSVCGCGLLYLRCNCFCSFVSTSCAVIASNPTQVELLRDRLESGKKQASLDQATALAAQMEARHAQRALDLLRTASTLPSSASSSLLSSSLFTSEAAALERALSEQAASVSTPGGVQAARSSTDSALLAPGATPPSSAAVTAAASAASAGATTSGAPAALATPSAAGSTDSSLHQPSTPSGAAVVKSEGGGGGGGSEDAGSAAAMKDAEAAEDLAALAATRLRQLEASRDKVLEERAGWLARSRTVRLLLRQSFLKLTMILSASYRHVLHFKSLLATSFKTGCSLGVLASLCTGAGIFSRESSQCSFQRQRCEWRQP